MLRTQTNHSPCRGLTTKQNDVNSWEHLKHPILNAFRKFWQFSSFYGDYVSQPLEHRGKKAILPQKTNG
jgi:hypothetical protein